MNHLARPFFNQLTAQTIAFASLAFATGSSIWAQPVKYEVVAETRDSVRAVSGKAQLGSFGNPAINDRGNVAFPAALFADNIGSTTAYSIVVKRGNLKKPQVALQGGIQQQFLRNFDSRTLSDDFLVLPAGSGENTSPVSGSARMFRISRSVAINKKSEVAFSGQLIETLETITRDDDGMVTDIKLEDRNFSTIGLVRAQGKTYDNFRVITYVDYNSEILERNLSINQEGTVPFRAIFEISEDEKLEGFAFNGPIASSPGPVATVASTVIGLPYFTTFQSFSDPIITESNRCIVVAQISEEGSEFDGIWWGRNPDLQPIVVKNRPAPRGGEYSSFDAVIGPSANGNWIAFTANITGAKGGVPRAAYRINPKNFETERVAAVGKNAPGVAGATFASVISAAANNRGQVVVYGTVLVDGRTRKGIWLSNRDGRSMRLMAIEGQTIRVRNRDKTINRLNFKPQNGVNNKGQVVFTPTFTDRTSAVVIAAIE